MSWTLFKANIKAIRTVWIIMTCVFCFYVSIIVSMFDPEGIDALVEMLEMMPEAMISAFGFTELGTTLLTFIVGYLYGFLILLFPMIISIVVNHRIIASHIDKGSMAFLLATPNSRIKIAFTQAAFSIISITTFFIVIVPVGILVAQSMYPGALEIGKFIMVNFYALILYYAIGGIGFLASCISNDSKQSLGIGVGFPVGFLVIQMLGNTGQEINWIKNFSMYTLFNPSRLIDGESFAYIGMAVLFTIAVTLYSSAIIIFNKRDLSI